MVDLSRVRLEGPLVAHAEGFAVWLTRQGYPPSSVLFHMRRLAHVSRWLRDSGVAAGAAEPAVVDAFVDSLPRGSRLARFSPGAFRPTWEYLRAVGAVVATKPEQPSSPVDVLLGRYSRYLLVERGLAAKTVARNIAAVARSWPGTFTTSSCGSTAWLLAT